MNNLGSISSLNIINKSVGDSTPPVPPVEYIYPFIKYDPNISRFMGSACVAVYQDNVYSNPDTTHIKHSIWIKDLSSLGMVGTPSAIGLSPESQVICKDGRYLEALDFDGIENIDMILVSVSGYRSSLLVAHKNKDALVTELEAIGTIDIILETVFEAKGATSDYEFHPERFNSLEDGSFTKPTLWGGDGSNGERTALIVPDKLDYMDDAPQLIYSDDHYLMDMLGFSYNGKDYRDFNSGAVNGHLYCSHRDGQDTRKQPIDENAHIMEDSTVDGLSDIYAILFNFSAVIPDAFVTVACRASDIDEVISELTGVGVVMDLPPFKVWSCHLEDGSWDYTWDNINKLR